MEVYGVSTVMSMAKSHEMNEKYPITGQVLLRKE